MVQTLDKPRCPRCGRVSRVRWVKERQRFICDYDGCEWTEVLDADGSTMEKRYDEP